LPGDSGQAGSPLLPAGSRLPAAIGAAVCAALTLLLAVMVHGHAAADGLDRVVDRSLHHSIGTHRGILTLITLIGEPIPSAILTAGLVVACLVARRWRAAALVVTAALAAPALGELVLKPLVARRIGTGTGSFPSGHAAITFALAVAVCVLLAQPPRPLTPALRRLLSLGALLVATIVSLAMVAINHHYFTDILGGAALATAVVLLTAFALDWLAARQGARRGPPPAGAHPRAAREHVG